MWRFLSQDMGAIMQLKQFATFAKDTPQLVTKSLTANSPVSANEKRRLRM